MEFLSALAEFVMPYLTAIIPIIAIFTRMSVFLFLVPGIGEIAVPARIRLAVAFLLTWLIVPLVLPTFDYSQITLTSGVVLIAKEGVIGFFLGFSLRLAVFVLQLVGNMISQALSISQPLGQGITLEPNTTISTLLMMVGITLLVSLDAHVLAFGIFYDSFAVFPFSEALDFDAIAYQMTDKAMGMFRISLSLAFPFLLLNFIYNLLLGFVNRAMPQLLVSFVGIPAITGVGLILLAISAGTVLTAWLAYYYGYSNQLVG